MSTEPLRTTSSNLNPPVEYSVRPPSARAMILRNVVFNWGGVAVGMAAGLITVPILIGRLGETLYGLWIIIGALTGYFYFLDLGLRGAIGRHVAYYDAKSDYVALNRMLSTAFILLGGAACLTLLGGGILAFAFDSFIKDIPPDRITEVRQTILIVSVSLALFFFWRAFDAFLWGVQRFDLLNLVDIPTTVTRLGLTVLLVTSDRGLVTLAWITLGTNVAAGLAKMWLSFRERPALSIRFAFCVGYLRELLAFGLWQFIGSLATLSVRSFVPAAIGATLGAIAVVPFSLALRLVEVAGQFAIAATGVVAPVSTLLHAHENLRVQRNLFIVGSQYCSCLSFFFTAGLVLLGRQTIVLWVGPEYAHAATYLKILAFGSMLPLAFGVSNSILIGLGRPKIASMIAVANAAVAITATTFFGRQGDLTNVCLAIAVSNTLFLGMLKPLVAGHLLRLAPLDLFTKALLPAIAVSSIPVALLYAAVEVHAPDSPIWLVAHVALFGALAVISVGLGINGSFAALRRCFVSAK